MEASHQRFAAIHQWASSAHVTHTAKPVRIDPYAETCSYASASNTSVKCPRLEGFRKPSISSRFKTQVRASNTQASDGRKVILTYQHCKSECQSEVHKVSNAGLIAKSDVSLDRQNKIRSNPITGHESFVVRFVHYHNNIERYASGETSHGNTQARHLMETHRRNISWKHKAHPCPTFVVILHHPAIKEKYNRLKYDKQTSRRMQNFKHSIAEVHIEDSQLNSSRKQHTPDPEE
jgi:hypothetical protein